MNDDQEKEKEKMKNLDCAHSSSFAEKVFLFFTHTVFFFGGGGGAVLSCLDDL